MRLQILKKKWHVNEHVFKTEKKKYMIVGFKLGPIGKNSTK